jgi:hypothetical protein
MAENIIKIWKEKNIDHVNFNFSCGGDSMNDTSIEIFDKEGELVQDSELETYFDDKTYNNVEFYVNSDGHYQGEFGVVTIEFDEDENDFTYSKSSSSEWSESSVNEAEIELTDEEVKFVADYVLNINGGEDDIQTNYKKDFILTNEQEETLKGLEEKISEFAQDYTPIELNDIEGEMNEWHTYTTNEEGEELKLVDNMLTLSINKSFDVIKED